MPKLGNRWVNLPYLICDREYLRQLEHGVDTSIHLATPLQTLRLADRGQFQAGPACPRVAVRDFDAETGKRRDGIKFLHQGIGKTVSKYDLGDDDLGPESSPEDFETDAFIQLNSFATVMKTLEFFEGPEILGREIPWAFPSEQLVVIPRAGEQKNAFYERESRSLQFFYHHAAGGHTIYTALSHDIIVHETTHAILDGLAPDLYNATTPQSLALHEAIADLAAITQKLLNKMVLFSLDVLTGPRPDDEPEVLARIAEEFGSDLRLADGANFLRRLKNSRTLNSADESVDEFGRSNAVDTTDPHALSTVLSGAVYSVIDKKMQAKREGRRVDAFADTIDQSFCPAARRVARIVFRALDYMPPGEVSFADYGRAFITTSAATYARPKKEQQWLREEFVRRGIVDDERQLDVEKNHPTLNLQGFSLKRLLSDRDTARRFVEENRKLFRIPPRRKFEVLTCVVASRSLGSRRKEKRNSELIFKVHWDESEAHDLGPRFAPRWAVKKGTTLVIDWAKRTILSRLTTDPSEVQYMARGALLQRWQSEGRLLAAGEAVGPDGSRLSDKVVAQARAGVMRIRGSVRTLHITAEGTVRQT